jgi:hypothetical protein
MINVNVRYNIINEIEFIEISGHAGSGPVGHDLVCAGVSSIVIGAANALKNLDQFDVKIEEGYTKIEMKQGGYITTHDAVVLETMFIQLKTIEQSFGSHIQVKNLQKGKKTK